MRQQYKNLVFTKHAVERLQDRTISLDTIWQVINYPDAKHSKDEEKIKFIRTLDQRKIHVIATKLDQENKWLIVSVWVRGEEDKAPLSWQLMTLPFKIVVWIVKKGITLIQSIKR